MTVYTPFLPPEDWEDPALSLLERFLPTEVTLACLENRPGGLVILVEPDDDLRAITEAVSSSWPALPPHKGNRPDLAYHMTVVRTANDRVRSDAHEAIAPHLRYASPEQKCGRPLARSRTGCTTPFLYRAAEARDLAFSSYVTWAALEAASNQLLRAKPKPRPRPVEHEPVILRNDIKSSTPEEVPFLPHSFVDGECQGCGLDLNDHRGRDRSCTPHGREMVMV